MMFDRIVYEIDYEYLYNYTGLGITGRPAAVINETQDATGVQDVVNELASITLGNFKEVVEITDENQINEQRESLSTTTTTEASIEEQVKERKMVAAMGYEVYH